MKTFDVVSDVISTSKDLIGDEYIVDKERLDILKEYCDVIDVFISNHDGTAISVNIISGNKISITVDLFDFMYEKGFKPKSYLDLIERAISVRFINKSKGSDVECMGVEFVFPSIWVVINK